MNVGDTVRIVSCNECPKAVGKTARVVDITDELGPDTVKVKFGRGRPQSNRPNDFVPGDVCLVKE